MSFIEFTGAILLLLMTPGPTNTLMALAGHSRGISKALPLIVSEAFGYLLVIVPVATLAAPFFAANPSLSLTTRILASIWVLVLSYRLWFQQKKQDTEQSVCGRDVLITTALNPKALIIALVIMPHGQPLALLPWLAWFVGLVIFAASGWIVFGNYMAKAPGFSLKPTAIRKIAATCLLLFAALLAGTSLRALA
jgi:threonine/homoserine/homoserine lactone efflux protein